MKLRCPLAAMVFVCTCSAPAPAEHPASKTPPRGTEGRVGTPTVAQLELGSGKPPGYAGDGADDGSEPSSPGLRALVRAPGARLEALADAGSHPLVCDLVGFGGRLHASFATKPIDRDGAQIHSWDGERWELAFDWDRGGVPGRTHEVSGQGIARLRVVDGRLHATDADAPRFGGFGLSNAPFEDYIFVTDDSGDFVALGAGDSPPEGTLVMGLAFHAFDVIRYRGAVVASGGTVAVHDRSGTRYPGGLWAAKAGERLLVPVLFPGEGKKVGVVRTTYMHRFAGRLYVGFQNNGGRIRWDVGVVDSDVDLLKEPRPDAMKLGRITPDGGWLTRRWASGGGWLYWVGVGYRGDGRGTVLYRSRDGVKWQRVVVPDGAGELHDVLVVGDVVLVLSRRGLYRSVAGGRWQKWADAPDGDPFGHYDSFCGAPMTAVGDEVYVGATRGGRVFRVVGGR